MDKNDKRTEELLSELAKQNKRLLVSSWVLTIFSGLFFLGVFLLTIYSLEENKVITGAILCAALAILFVGLAFAFKAEVDAGYYECRNCNHKFLPSYKEALFAAHTPTKKYLKCPECGRKTWTKKVMSK